MKIINKIIFFTAAAMLISVINGYAYSDNEFSQLNITPSNGFYTVITDSEGDEHIYSGVIDADKLENYDCADKIASYEIFSDGASLIKVTLNDIIPNSAQLMSESGTPIVNGYYSVKFTLSEGDNTEVFLTGLSDSNLDMVQEKLISARLEYSQFTMESLDFIDTEKTNMPNDGDNELCWAATTANMLQYTGWGQKADFNSEDDLLDLFRDSFTDMPSDQFYGLNWFFSDTYCCGKLKLTMGCKILLRGCIYHS